MLGTWPFLPCHVPPSCLHLRLWGPWLKAIPLRSRFGCGRCALLNGQEDSTVTSWLICCSMLCDTFLKTFHKLQVVRNAAAGILSKTEVSYYASFETTAFITSQFPDTIQTAGIDLLKSSAVMFLIIWKKNAFSLIFQSPLCSDCQKRPSPVLIPSSDNPLPRDKLPTLEQA